MLQYVEIYFNHEGECADCDLCILIFSLFEDKISEAKQSYIWEGFKTLHAYQLKFILVTVLPISIL